MGLLPFDMSYIVFTPRRVRLPGEPPRSPPASPTKTDGARSQSMRIRGNGASKSPKSLRSLWGAKSSNNLAALRLEKARSGAPEGPEPEAPEVF